MHLENSEMNMSTSPSDAPWTFEEAKRFVLYLREKGADFRSIAKAMGTKSEEQLGLMFNQVKLEMKGLSPAWKENDFDEVLKIIDLEQRLLRSKKHPRSGDAPFVGLFPASKSCTSAFDYFFRLDHP
jgi:hypothetical protein